MEGPSFQDDAPLVHRRSTSYRSLTARDELRVRVRSLRVLRNQRPTPRTSPSLREQRRDIRSQEGSSATSGAAALSLSEEAPESSITAESEESLTPVMAITRFDGPASQIGDIGDRAPRRHLSQPDIAQDTSLPDGDRLAPTLTGLNQRHAGGTVAQEQGGSTDLPPMPSRSPFNRSSGRYKPQCDLKTLTPANAQPTRKPLRPGLHNIPNSYRSDITQMNMRGPNSPAADISGEEVHQQQRQAQGSHSTFTSTAIESLSHAQEHSAVLPARPSVQPRRSNTSLRRTTSYESVRSAFSVKTLFKPNGAMPGSSQVAEPVMSSGTDYGQPRDQMPFSRTPAMVQAMTEDSVQRQGIAEPAKPPQFTQTPVATTDTQLLDLLAQLPPVSQMTMEGRDHHYLMPTPSEESKQLHRSKTFREHSREVSSHDEREDRVFQDRSDLPMKATEPLNRIPEQRRTSSVNQAPNPPTPGSPRSSASQTAASIKRALTALSEISSKSNGSRIHLAPLRSSTNYERLDDPVDTPKNVAPQGAPIRSSWVQSFLGRSSTIATSAAASLTAKHSPQGDKANETTERRRSKALPVTQSSMAASDENALRDQSVRDAMRNLAIARQQEQNVESFSKVIQDLEDLLKGPLLIAPQAAEGKDAEAGACLHLHVRSGSLKGSRVGSDVSSEDESVFSGGPDEEEHYTSEPRIIIHPHQEHVTVVEPPMEERYKEHYGKARGATPYPSATRNASVVPPADQEEPAENQTSLLQRSGSKSDNGFLQPVISKDWAVQNRQPTMRSSDLDDLPLLPRQPIIAQAPLKEQNAFLARKQTPSSKVLSDQAVRQYINDHQKSTTQPRAGTFKLRPRQKYHESTEAHEMEKFRSSRDSSEVHVHEQSDSDDPVAKYYKDAERNTPDQGRSRSKGVSDPDKRRQSTISPLPDRHIELEDRGPIKQGSIRNGRRSHFSIKEPPGFSLSRSHKRAPIARDWSDSRKRWTAMIACLSTALLGLIIGIYAGEVPAIQYAIVDEHHYTILGNVVFFVGLAITTVLFFPLPLLHGRKPYTLAALAILMPLQFPQALAVNTQRSPSVATYRVGLILPRAIAGLVCGFANINFLSTLLDLFGASLQSSSPHQEVVDINDVRRHGGGMGMWLGLWTWCFIGSIGVGFFIGAVIISGLNVAWGFWITIILTAAILILNVLAPETRRSAYRRSLAEVRNGGEVSRRIARGEIKMHLDATGPIYWWEEVTAGTRLCIRMLKQPGFAILSLYLGWIYGQIVIVIVLLGALMSKYYRFRPQYVGLCVLAIPLGAFLATPFQKASVLSRSRMHKPRTDSMTVQKRVSRSSHFVRRGVFMILLPFAGLAYTLSSGGERIHFMVPTVFAGVIGFLSNLAIAECNGIIMETYDTSDLQPGMTGRPRKALPDEIARKRTNFSCFPRVTAAFTISQAFAFLIAAAATGTGGAIERSIGAKQATGVVAGILLILTMLLIAVVTRFKTVQIIPSQRYGTAILSGPENEWKPVIIGHPSGTTRRMSLLELGKMSRWTEIRRRNRLMSGLSATD